MRFYRLHELIIALMLTVLSLSCDRYEVLHETSAVRMLQEEASAVVPDEEEFYTVKDTVEEETGAPGESSEPEEQSVSENEGSGQ